jgi:hypothetical protein
VRKPKLVAAIGMGVLIAMRSADGRAQDSACELVALDASPDLDPPWRRAANDLRAALAHELTGGECVPFRLRVEPSPEGVVVRAQSADGLETTRAVREPRALVPVVLGLLASAPVEPRAPSPPQAPSAAPPTLPARVDVEVRDLSDLPASRAEGNVAPASVGVALGLSTGVRVGLPTDVIVWDSELRADVLLHDWSILAFMRYAFLGAVSGIAADTDEYEEIGMGFGVGRELHWGRHTLDLSASPSVVFVNMESDGAVTKEGEGAQLRINAAARYGYGLGRGWRLTLTLDSEAAPSSLVKARYPEPGLPPLPAWTVGFQLGAAASLL